MLTVKRSLDDIQGHPLRYISRTSAKELSTTRKQLDATVENTWRGCHMFCNGFRLRENHASFDNEVPSRIRIRNKAK